MPARTEPEEPNKSPGNSHVNTWLRSLRRVPSKRMVFDVVQDQERNAKELESPEEYEKNTLLLKYTQLELARV